MTEDVAVLVGEQDVDAVGVASLHISTKVKVEKLNVHFEYYLSEMKRGFFAGRGGQQNVFLHRGCRAIGSTTLQCAHSFVLCSEAI